MATKKKAKTATAAPSAQTPKLSLVKAAMVVLDQSDDAMNTKAIIEAAKAKHLWEPTGGKTPEQTLYSAMVREIKAKGTAARFKLVARGHFALNRDRA